MITREQVADLREGDIVELVFAQDPNITIRGPLDEDQDGTLQLGRYGVIRFEDGEVPRGGTDRTLTVVSRAPRPLYVNHHRTEPVPGDTVHPGDGTSSIAFRTVNGWVWPNGTWARVAGDGLRLLVDGESGQVVP